MSCDLGKVGREILYELSTPGYRSIVDYRMDPFAQTAQRVQSVWANTPKRPRPRYSSTRKAFEPTVPATAYRAFQLQSQGQLPMAALHKFDIDRLSQTDVSNIDSIKPQGLRSVGEVSLARVVKDRANQMGTMRDWSTGEGIGSCTLIADNLVLVARHAVAGVGITDIGIDFGYYLDREGFPCWISSATVVNVIEDDREHDYAILQLDKSVGATLGCVPLSIQPDILTAPALLHYPLNGPLKVSVHTYNQSPGRIGPIRMFHDSDYYSSGGAYFDPQGSMIAMHLGSEGGTRSWNLMRYAMPLGDIVTQKPQSVLAQLVEDGLSQNVSYSRHDQQRVDYLRPAPHNYLIDEEGYRSEQVLRKHLGSAFDTDSNIKKTKAKKISFSKANLKYIEENYPDKYDDFVEECLGVAGWHANSKQYSVKGRIESDHTIPHNVWKATINTDMRYLVRGGGTRPGENFMPAITIPYDSHRPLRTTGSSSEARAFCKNLVKLCNQYKVDDALILCFKEYEANGIDLDAYKVDIDTSLDQYMSLGVITAAQKARVKRKIF